MKNKIFLKVVMVCRLTMGLIFLVMGVMGLIRISNMPGESESANAFINALNQVQYFWPFEKIVEIISGLMLLTKRFVPLAVDILAAIIVNIMLFHIFTDLKGIGLALIVFICELVLFIYLWPNHFKEMFRARSDVP